MKSMIAMILIGFLFLSILVHANLVYSQTLDYESPLKQFENGISVNNIKCMEGLILIVKKSDSSPACVEMQTVQKLIERGWAKEIVSNTSQNTTLPASYMPCDTPYSESNASSTFLYMPVNSIGKLCVRYSTFSNSAAPVVIDIFEANDTSRNHNATEIITRASANMVPKGTDMTVVYTIKTGNYSGFYGLRLFCNGMPFAVGYGNDSVKPINFAEIGHQIMCPGQPFGYHIVGLTGISVKHFQ